MSYIDVLRESEDQVTAGMSACQGCGGELLLRTVLQIAGPNTIMLIPPGCMAGAGVIGWNHQNGMKIPVHIPLLDNTASFASGLSQQYQRQGREDVNIICFGGDGATADCGFMSLSAAAERNEKMLYICYDNEAYMNTGIQKSSLTPFGAKTTTTPAGKNSHGCLTQKKNVFEIVAAHGIPYAATASVGYLPDFLKKLERAKGIHGTRFIHVIAPCPTGWGCPEADMVDIARDIVDCGLWYLAEYEGPAISGKPGGSFKLNRNPKEFTSVEAYLRRQVRFKALTDDEVAQVEAGRDAKWEQMRRDWA